MKKTSAIGFLFFLLLYSCSQKPNETFIPGTFWMDNEQQLINAHGGGILYHEGKYYWFGENKSDTTSLAMTGVSCYSSENLYNWHNEGIALSVSSDPESDITKGCIMERPKVIYNKTDKIFVMYFHLEQKGKGYDAARVGLAVSSQITGPYTFLHSYRPNAGHLPLNLPQNPTCDINPEHYVIYSPEWEKAVKEGMYAYRDLLHGQMSRDMTLFVDDDGKAYHIYASEENMTLHIAELSSDYLSHTGRYIRVMPGGHNEAPCIFKKSGKYYLITSGCTGWKPNAAKLAIADSIMGEWKVFPNPCRGTDANLTFNSQGTYILPLQNTEDSFIFMADRWNPENHTKGTYVWLPIQFDHDIPYIEWSDLWSLDVFNKNSKILTATIL